MLTSHCSRWLIPGVATLALSTAAPAQRPGKPVLEEVAAAMGGRDRILAVKTLVFEGTGENYNLGQNPAAEAPLPVYAVTKYRRAIDFPNRRWRIDQTREPRFLTGNTAPQRQRLAYDSVAFDIAADDRVTRSAGRADVDRANELLYHPIGFVQVALAAGTELSEEAASGGMRRVRMNAGGNKLAIVVDPRTKLPVRIEKIIYHPFLGDALLETQLSDWREVDGVKLPTHVVQRLDGRWTLSDIHLASMLVNSDAGDLAAPADVRSAQAPAPAINVTTEEIAPGVWFLAGQSHHSVAIEMRDHLLLVEAPLNDARTLAVIRRARELRPGKPIHAVITTHHHFDHAGGVRAAIAEGLTVITHAKNKTFFDSLARRRHFIVEDALAKAPKPARIETVDSKRVLTDGVRTVEIHHISGSPHAETLLMVYLPAEKLLIEADVYTPPAPNASPPPSFPFAANLVDNIDRLGLKVDRIVPIHGQIAPMSDLRAAAGATSAR
jgi:glyoxylase-like metal-dependent hydrolase (beta-lactamase superfamily II)